MHDLFAIAKFLLLLLTTDHSLCKLVNFVIVMNYCVLYLQFAFERYVAENLNDHKQGIFRQSVSTDSMLSWTKVSSSFYNFCHPE